MRDLKSDANASKSDANASSPPATNQAPDRIQATRVRNGKPDRTRPLCPYPQTAVYKGAGSTDEASNFVCK